jgi:hypothetical protein
MMQHDACMFMMHMMTLYIQHYKGYEERLKGKLQEQLNSSINNENNGRWARRLFNQFLSRDLVVPFMAMKAHSRRSNQ